MDYVAVTKYTDIFTYQSLVWTSSDSPVSLVGGEVYLMNLNKTGLKLCLKEKEKLICYSRSKDSWVEEADI